MSDVDTNALRDALHTATQGDWSVAAETADEARAIIAAVNAAPAMLDEIDALRAKVEELEARCERLLRRNESLNEAVRNAADR